MRPSSTRAAHHPAELEDAGRVEAVRGLVQDQQLGVGQQAAGDAEPLAHAERVAADAVVGALAQADPLERRVDPAVRLGLARRGDDLEVLAAGQERVEARLLDDRPDPGQRGGALARASGGRGCACCRELADVSPSSIRISVVLPAPFGPR